MLPAILFSAPVILGVALKDRRGGGEGKKIPRPQPASVIAGVPDSAPAPDRKKILSIH
jgi:hypothetical protein